MAIPTLDAKVLWGRSGSRCAFPDCRKDLTFGSGAGIIGEMAHIIATRADGPRGDLSLAQNLRDSYSNLILLCPAHHTLIDKDETTWTVDKLKELKTNHEKWVDSQLSKGFLWRSDLSTIHYLNVPRVIFDLAARGKLLEFADFEIDRQQGLRGMGLDLARLLITFRDVFNDWHPEALYLDREGALDAANVGARIKFAREFKPKHVPGPDKLDSGSFRLKGTIEDDPHIHCEQGARNVYLPIDPQWITTNTAFVDFRLTGNRKSVFCGLGILKYVDDSMAVITPLVLGLP